MEIEIVIPSNRRQIADGREMNYEYTAEIGAQPPLTAPADSPAHDLALDDQRWLDQQDHRRGGVRRRMGGERDAVIPSPINPTR